MSADDKQEPGYSLCKNNIANIDPKRYCVHPSRALACMMNPAFQYMRMVSVKAATHTSELVGN